MKPEVKPEVILPFGNSHSVTNCDELNFANQLDFFYKMENFLPHIDISENIFSMNTLLKILF